MLRALDDDSLRELASIFPSLPRREGGTESHGEGVERYRLHYAIRSVLERLARRQPMLLALDDVHWADAGSVEMLTHLLRRFRGPLLTAVAYRPSPTRLLAALEGAARGRLGSRLDLLPLTSKESGRLIGSDTDDATRATLYRQSGGNPFYIEQLARASHVQGLRPVRGPARSREAVPRAVIAAINEELIAVSTDSRRVLEAAAVAGESFEPELIAAIAERDVTMVLGRTGRASERRFHPTDGRAAALSLQASDRTQGGLRRDAARLANRRARASSGGVGRSTSARQCAGTPRRGIRPRRRRAGDRVAGTGRPRSGAACPGDGRTLVARGDPAAGAERQRAATPVAARRGGNRADVRRRL